MSFKISGMIKELESQKGLPDVLVEAYDADLFRDDALGKTKTDPSGRFIIGYDYPGDKGFLHDNPDIYIIVKNAQGKTVKSTRNTIIKNVKNNVEITMEIPKATLAAFNLTDRTPPVIDDNLRKQYTTWTFKSGYNTNDPTLATVQNDLHGKTSIMALLKSYMIELKKTADNNAPQFDAMAKLFEMGADLEGLDGMYFGVPTGLRTGDENDPLAPIGNILGLLWGGTLEDECPWVGKSFLPMEDSRLSAITGISTPSRVKTFLGINHFNKIELKALNTISFQALNWWLSLENSPGFDPAHHSYEKDGGHFIAKKAQSVYHGSKREVLQLNYRWKHLGNRPPLAWLIDEMVMIAEGLYLGQLLFATKRILSDFDPDRPDSDYTYQHFGYFILFDARWHPEARRLFPYLELPEVDESTSGTGTVTSLTLPKYSTFTTDPTILPVCKNGRYAQILVDMKSKPTIIHLLKEYSDTLQKKSDGNSIYFEKLQEFFNRGLPVREMKGFYRGALISWQSEGLFKLFNVNILNVGWAGFIRQLSTWTGKTIEDISRERLENITDGFEKGVIPTFWGANTQSLRTVKEKIVGHCMNIAQVWIEQIPEEDRRKYGYDIKNFFFIAHQAKSINPGNKEKSVFQFNYRWPKLKTIIPDRYCIDEIVQIADGLFLGQLMYATEICKPYDPAIDPETYRYKNFGYFLLMDEEWHRLRLKIGFDLDNA